MALTIYTILVMKTEAPDPADAVDPETAEWVIGADGIEAHSARGAVSRFVREEEVTGGVFVAIPVRSWMPVTVETETQTKIKIS